MAGAHAQEPERIWRICVSDAAVPPYLYNDANRPGVIERILMHAGREVGLNTLILRYPTPRCRRMMFEGTMDAVIMTALPTNTEAFRFPMKDGAVDVSKRIAAVNLVWVKRSGTPYDWTEAGMKGGKPAELLVGTRALMLVAIEPLEKLGFKVDSTALTSSQLMLKLQKQRLDLAVALQEEVELAMQDPRMHELEVLPRRLATAVYYMAVRKDIGPNLHGQIDAWWAAIGRARERPEFKGD